MCIRDRHATEPPAEVVHEAQVADSLVADSLIVDSLNTPPPATEVRAVWLTTNYGLDWPRNRTSVEAQKRELREMLDGLQALRFNTVFFQVRARGEVFYLSRLEPMSTLIATARKGEPFFDQMCIRDSYQLSYFRDYFKQHLAKVAFISFLGQGRALPTELLPQRTLLPRQLLLLQVRLQSYLFVS